MTFLCEEILRCISGEGLSIGQETESLDGFTPDKAIAGFVGGGLGGAIVPATTGIGATLSPLSI